MKVTRTRSNPRLAGEATACRPSYELEELPLLVVRRFEQLGPLHDFDVTRPARRRAAGKRHGRKDAVANVQELAPFGHLDELVSAKPGSFELDGGHLRQA